MKRIALIAAMFAFAVPAVAQRPITEQQLANADIAGVIRIVGSAPSGACTEKSPPQFRALRTTTQFTIYGCVSSVWAALDSTEDGGAAGDISDVFNCATGDCNAIVMASGDSLDGSSGDVILPSGTVAQLPGAPSTGQVFYVTNGDGAEDCSAGLQGTFVECVYNGSAWVSMSAGGGGGGGGDDVTVAGTAVDTTANLVSTGDITFTHSDGGAGGPDDISATINTAAVSAAELDEAGVEAGLEAVMDLEDMQGAVTDGQVPNTITIDLAATATALAADPADCAANNFATTIAASGALTCAQPAFTDLSGTASEAQVPLATSASDLTCTNCINATEIEDIYVLTAGDSMSGQLSVPAAGIEFSESDSNPTCASNNFNIFADMSELKLKACNNGRSAVIATINEPADLDGDGNPDTIFVGDYDKDGALEIIDDIKAAMTALTDTGPKYMFIGPGNYCSSHDASGACGDTLATDTGDAGMDGVLEIVNNITIECSGPLSTTLTGPLFNDTFAGNENYTGAVITSAAADASNIHIRNCGLDGGTPTTSWEDDPDDVGTDYPSSHHRMGVYFDGCENCSFTDGYIANTYHSCLYGKNLNDVKFDNNFVENCGGYTGDDAGDANLYPCIYVFADDNGGANGDGSDNVSVANNQADGCGDSFVVLRRDDTANNCDTSECPITNISVTGNTGTNTGQLADTTDFGKCMVIRGANGVVVSDHVCTDSGPFKFESASAYYDDPDAVYANRLDAVKNITINGVEMTGGEAGFLIGPYNQGIHVSNMNISETDLACITLGTTSPDDSTMKDIVFENVTMRKCGRRGIDEVTSSAGPDNALDGITFRNIVIDQVDYEGANDTTYYDGIKFNNPISDFTLDGFSISGVSKHGINIVGMTNSRIINGNINMLAGDYQGSSTYAGLPTTPCVAANEGAWYWVSDSDACVAGSGSGVRCTCVAGTLTQWTNYQNSLANAIYFGNGGSVSSSNVIANVTFSNADGDPFIQLDGTNTTSDSVFSGLLGYDDNPSTAAGDLFNIGTGDDNNIIAASRCDPSLASCITDVGTGTIIYGLVSEGDVDLSINATADGTGSTSNVSGLERSATGGLALIQGCSDDQILKWDDGTSKWECGGDASGAGAWSDVNPVLLATIADDVAIGPDGATACSGSTPCAPTTQPKLNVSVDGDQYGMTITVDNPGTCSASTCAAGARSGLACVDDEDCPLGTKEIFEICLEWDGDTCDESVMRMSQAGRLMLNEGLVTTHETEDILTIKGDGTDYVNVMVIEPDGVMIGDGAGPDHTTATLRLGAPASTFGHYQQLALDDYESCDSGTCNTGEHYICADTTDDTIYACLGGTMTAWGTGGSSEWTDNVGGWLHPNEDEIVQSDATFGAADWKLEPDGDIFGATLNLENSATPKVLLHDSTTDGEVAIAMDDDAGPDGRMQLQVDVADTLTTFVEIDGINSDIELGTPGTNYVDITTAGVVSFVGTADIELPDDSVDIADLSATGTADATTFLRGDNTWTTPAGSGDVTAVGDCLSGDCFTGASGTLLQSNTDLIMELDNDANGSNTFLVKDGADFNVASIGETAITFGRSTTTSFTVTTDSTGTAEVVLPAGSIDSTEILDGEIVAADLNMTSNFAPTGEWDFGGGGLEIENGTTPPACTVGQIYLDTDATSGQQLMACEGGTFVLQGDGGGAETNTLTTVTTGIADDQLVVGTATDTAAYKTIADCTDSNGNHLNYTASTNEFSCGTSGPLLNNIGGIGGAATFTQLGNHEVSYRSTWNADTAFEFVAVEHTTAITFGDTAEQTLFTIENHDDAGTGIPPDIMMDIDNEDTNGLVDIGIRIVSAAGGITDAIDVSDAELVNAINVGANPIVSNTDVIIDLDNDNDGTETFQIRDGADSIVFEVSEAGAITSGTLTTANSVDSDQYTDGSIDDIHIGSLVKSMYWPAGSLSVDGTQCTVPTEQTLNSGPKQYTIVCADDSASTIYGSVVMPDGWNGTTVTFELSVLSDNATPADEYHVDFSGQCRGNSDVVNSTWGSAATTGADIDFDASGTCGGSACVQWELAQATTSAVTPDGTCAAGDTLFWRGQVEPTGTTATVADVLILGVKMEYTWGDSATHDDN